MTPEGEPCRTEMPTRAFAHRSPRSTTRAGSAGCSRRCRGSPPTPDRPRRPRRAGQARRAHGHQREPDGRPVRADRRPDPQRRQPRQPAPHRRHDVPRAVPRPRHDVRPDVEPRPRPGPRVPPELPHPGARPGQRLRRRPGVSPHLYDQSVDHGRTTMLVEPNVGSEAVCIDGRARTTSRATAQGTALIGDPRNDENLIVDQLHLGVPALPQPRRRRRPGRPRPARHTGRAVRRGAADRPVALPVDDPPRVPAD